MSTSPPSEPGVALLWSDRWWVSDAVEPLIFGEGRPAAPALLHHYSAHGRPARLRLLYQPDHLTCMEVTGPNGGRTILQAALQDEHPALANPACAWSFEPMARGANTTLLHFETEPGLLPLVAALQDNGIQVEGAWPLVTALNFVPTDWPDSGALTVVAVAKGQAVIFRHTPTGARTVDVARDDRAAELVATTLHLAFTGEATAVHLVAFDETGRELVEQTADINDPGPGRHDWEAVVRAARSLSLRHSGQLLPPASRFNVGLMAGTVTLIALLTAGWLGWQITRDVLGQRHAAAAHQAETASLQTEVTRLRANATEAQRIQGELEALARGPVAVSALLRTLARQIPADVVLTRIQADRTGFIIAGGISGSGLAPSAWQDWLQSLQGASHHGPVTSDAPSIPTADFTLKGSWP